MGGILQAAVGDLKTIDTSKFKKKYAGLYYIVEQTKHLKSIFDDCQNQPWCIYKHFVSYDLRELIVNDRANVNYFIYSSEKGNPIKELIK